MAAIRHVDELPRFIGLARQPDEEDDDERDNSQHEVGSLRVFSMMSLYAESLLLPMTASW